MGIICCAFVGFTQPAQHITGKVTDGKTGEPLPYVTISVKLPAHQIKAVSTDFAGLYDLVFPVGAASDSIFATYVSYVTGKKALGRTDKTVDFQLQPDNQMLKDVIVTPHSYENPAWDIMRKVIAHKDSNNFDKLRSYSFESYKRVDLSINKITEKLRRRKFMQQLTPVLDSLKKTAGSDGTVILPIFMSESISNIYYNRKPERKTEQVLSTHSKGVGIEDPTLISQIVSAGFQQYNFYQNYLRLAGKDFISPVTDSWKLLYEYELVENNDVINGVPCYRIAFKPKRVHDLAFAGIMWITQNGYALYRIDVSVSEEANLDFFDKIRIQQEMTQPAGTNAWLPEKTRVIVQVSNLIKNQPGFIGKFYLANKNIEVNKNFPQRLFQEPLTIENNAVKNDESYWAQHRYDTLTTVDRRTYQIIDTVKNLPIVKSYANIASTIINGYYRVGKISLGPYLYSYSYNDLQGSVVRLGGMTNRYFSNRIILGGYASYAFLNRKVNYGVSADYILSRKPWMQMGVSYSHDLAQTGYQFENFSKSNNVFRASIRNGSVSRRGPFTQNDFKTYIQYDITGTLLGQVTFAHRTFDPLFDFTYRRRDDGDLIHDYQVSEAVAELQWTPGRRELQSEQINKRLLINDGEDNPVVTFRYTHGAKAFGGDFNYNKFAANVIQKLHMGILGKGEYSLTGGFIPSALPFPLLENHRFNFNTMRFLEFTSDKYVSLTYTQHMEGLLTNSLPLLKALNLRTVADVNILVGSISENNNTIRLRNGLRRYDRSLGGRPYMEVGYGVENILKFLRFDVLYRLNHNDHLDEAGKLPGRIAFRTSLQFRL